MNDNELILLNLAAGQIMPYVTDFANRYVKSSTVRFWVSFVTCAAVGLLFNFDQMQWANRSQIILSVLTVWFSAQAAYKTYYEGSQFQYKIRKPIISETAPVN